MVEVGKDLYCSSGLASLLKQGHPGCAQGHVQMAFEYLQGGRLHNLYRTACIYIVSQYSQSTAVSFEFLPSFPSIYQCKMCVIYMYLYGWCMYTYIHIHYVYMYKICLFSKCIKSLKHLDSALSMYMCFKSICSQPAFWLPKLKCSLPRQFCLQL